MIENAMLLAVGKAPANGQTMIRRQRGDTLPPCHQYAARSGTTLVVVKMLDLLAQFAFDIQRVVVDHHQARLTILGGLTPR